MKPYDVDTASVSPSRSGSFTQNRCPSPWICTMSVFFPDGVPAVSAKHDVHKRTKQMKPQAQFVMFCTLSHAHMYLSACVL